MNLINLLELNYKLYLYNIQCVWQNVSIFCCRTSRLDQLHAKNRWYMLGYVKLLHVEVNIAMAQAMYFEHSKHSIVLPWQGGRTDENRWKCILSPVCVFELALRSMWYNNNTVWDACIHCANNCVCCKCFSWHREVHFKINEVNILAEKCVTA